MLKLILLITQTSGPIMVLLNWTMTQTIGEVHYAVALLDFHYVFKF